MRNPGVVGALLFAVMVSTGCRGAFTPSGLEASKWQLPSDHAKRIASAQPRATAPSRKLQEPQDPKYLVRPAGHVASAITIPKDYLNDPPPTPPTEEASSGLVRRSQHRPWSRPRIFPRAAESSPVEKRQSGAEPDAEPIASGDAELMMRESSEPIAAPRTFEPALNAVPAAEAWEEPSDSDADGNPLRSEEDRPVVSAARWTYDRPDVQPAKRLRANPLRP